VAPWSSGSPEKIQCLQSGDEDGGATNRKALAKTNSKPPIFITHTVRILKSILQPNKCN